MTKKSYLEQYAALSAEIIQLEHELCKLSSQPTHLATDCVMASPAHEPYQNIPTPISGHVQENSVSRERRKLMKKYDEKLAVLYKCRNYAEEIIMDIEDARARTIIRYRYIDGLEWKDVAVKMGGSNTEEGVKKCAQRAIEKIL